MSDIKSFVVRAPSDITERLAAKAKELGVSRNALVLALVTAYLDPTPAVMPAPTLTVVPAPDPYQHAPEERVVEPTTKNKRSSPSPSTPSSRPVEPDGPPGQLADGVKNHRHRRHDLIETKYDKGHEMKHWRCDCGHDLGWQA